MRVRISEHTRPNRSTFAWRYGADLLKQPVATVSHVTPRLAQAMRGRLLRKLLVRYIEESDPVRRCLLEIYVHVALKTPYNTFGVRRKEDMRLLIRSLDRMRREGRQERR
jgi:hypothetical protein